jgi:hypothetical protein
VTLQELCTAAGRPAGALTRRDVARGLLSVPAAEALEALPNLRRGLTAADNPLSRAFWEHAEALLTRIAAGSATVGEVRAWLEATGAEPTTLVAGGFVWPDEEERGPVARDMHARLVAHLEGLVAAGAVDPDRLLAGDEAALAAYEEAQEAWLYQPLPDGRQPIWAVDEEETAGFLAAWDDAEADARAILDELLAPLGARACPEADLAAACTRLRARLAEGGWPYDLLAAAGGVDVADLPADDRELWLELAAGVVECRDDPPERGPNDDIAYAAWFRLDHPAWIAVVVSLTRAGPGTAADARTLGRLAATFDFEAEPGEEHRLEADPDEVLSCTVGFGTVELLWSALGALDRHAQLTPLGWWGLPEALARAWQPADADPA